MAKFSPISWPHLVKKLKKFGFEGPYRGGKHPYMVKGDLVLTIPNPHKKEISVDLLRRILRQAGIEKEKWTEEDWVNQSKLEPGVKHIPGGEIIMEEVMINGLRIWFLVLYAIGIISLLIKFVPTRDRAKTAERRIEDSRRLLPMIFLPVDWLVPPLILLSGIGQLSAAWLPIRLLGFALSLYAFIILAWVPRVLGRFLVPQAAVFSDHVLVTAGPFKFLRHPSFSGALALWLGTALGTLNWLLLALWFLLVVGKTIQARTEEELLRTKFGSAYDAYTRQTGRFIPKFWGRGQCK